MLCCQSEWLVESARGSCQAAVVRTAPGIDKEIDPPYAQMQVDPATRTGMPPAVICGAIGIHGAGTTGTHGIGVSTPSAAAVAAATVGLASDWHIPNGAMFTPGAISVMVATGRPSTTGRGATTDNVDGASPNVHMIIAPETTQGLPTRPPRRPARTPEMLGDNRFHTLAAFTDDVSWAPVVVTKQTTDRSLDCSQPRADGSR